MNQTLSIAQILWAFGIGSAYAFWPILGRYSGASGIWISTIATIGTAIGSIALAYPSMKGQSLPIMSAVGLLIFAGLINGVAVYFYSIKMADRQIPANAFIVTTIIAMLTMTMVFNFLLNGAVPSTRQWFGLGAATLTVVLLAG